MWTGACSHSFDADINSATKLLDPATVRTLPKKSILNYKLFVVIVTDWSTMECTRYTYTYVSNATYSMCS
jgi:hypothetical protein